MQQQLAEERAATVEPIQEDSTSGPTFLSSLTDVGVATKTETEDEHEDEVHVTRGVDLERQELQRLVNRQERVALELDATVQSSEAVEEEDIEADVGLVAIPGEGAGSTSVDEADPVPVPMDDAAPADATALHAEVGAEVDVGGDLEHSDEAEEHPVRIAARSKKNAKKDKGKGKAMDQSSLGPDLLNEEQGHETPAGSDQEAGTLRYHLLIFA